MLDITDIIFKGYFNYKDKTIRYKVYIKEKPLNVLGYIDYHIMIKYKKGLFSKKISIYQNDNLYSVTDWYSKKLTNQSIFNDYIREKIIKDINKK